MNQIVEMALNARTVRDVESLEGELRTGGARRIRFLGDRETNWSTLSNAADPKGILFERATNGFDSLIELEVQRQHPSVAELASPAGAARKLFDIPKAGLAEMTMAERDQLGKLSLISLFDSDDSRRRPTIAFRDFGIGVSRKEAPYTLLSLEGSNKLSKPYQHGVFGKGGSLACMFSAATVLVMRKQPDLLAPGGRDEIVVAVVRHDDNDEFGLPFFRYLVCDNPDEPKGLPWACPATEAEEFEPGVYVAHIGYQADRMGQENWNQEGSIYAYAETVLFRPTLPFGLADNRTPPANRRPEGRGVSILSGLGLRLERLEAASDQKDLQDAERAPLLRKSEFSSIPVPSFGTMRVRWWLFRDNNRRRSYVAHGYVTVLTHDGQVHHAWDQQRFQTLVPTRRRVAERIFVEVDLEEVPRKQRVQILSSMREALRKTPQARKLEEAIAHWLENDPDLEEAETRLTREALQRTAQRITKNFLEKLNRAIAAKVPTLKVLVDRKGRGPRPKPPRLPEELYSEPTSFTGPAGISLLPGENHAFYMAINAADGFLPARGQIELRNAPADAELSLSVGDLRRGRIQLGIVAGDEAALGTHQVVLVLSWLRSGGGIGELRWPLSITILAERSEPQPPRPPKSKEDAGQAKGKRRSIFALVWNRVEDHRASGWTEETAGDLQRLPGRVLAEQNPDLYGDLRDVDTDVATIVLNKDFEAWAAYRRGSSLSGDPAMQSRSERYGIALGVAIANLWGREEALAKKYAAWQIQQNGGDEPEKPMDEAQRRRAISEAARGILALLPDFDRLAIEVEERATA